MVWNRNPIAKKTPSSPPCSKVFLSILTICFPKKIKHSASAITNLKTTYIDAEQCCIPIVVNKNVAPQIVVPKNSSDFAFQGFKLLSAMFI